MLHIGGVTVSVNASKQRIAVSINRQPFVCLEAAVQLPFDVDRNLLIVRTGDILAHGPNLHVITLTGKDIRAQHRAVILERLHGQQPDLLAFLFEVLQGSPGQVAGRPAGHDNDDLAAFL